MFGTIVPGRVRLRYYRVRNWDERGVSGVTLAGTVALGYTVLGCA